MSEALRMDNLAPEALALIQEGKPSPRPRAIASNDSCQQTQDESTASPESPESQMEATAKEPEFARARRKETHKKESDENVP